MMGIWDVEESESEFMLRVGVVIARFQTASLTAGHKAVLREVEKHSDVVVILLGVSPLDKRQREHALSYAQRVHVVQRDYPRGLVLPLPNQRNDREWSQSVDRLLTTTFPGAHITLFAGRASGILPTCDREGYSGILTVKELPEIKDLSSATAARQAIVEGFDTRFMEGQIHALESQFPHAYQAVDVALTFYRPDDPEPHVYVITRADTGALAFPGGFVDPSDPSLEMAAGRECHEELGIELNASLFRYVGSMMVSDWRYRGCTDQIMTALFAVPVAYNEVFVTNPDEVLDVRPYPIADPQLYQLISSSHRPLLDMLRRSKFGDRIVLDKEEVW